MNHRVSLYIPVYNAEKYIDRVIPSVMAQTYPIQEILIINDGSIDNSLEKIKRHTVNAKYPIRIISHSKNKGLGAVRNTGVRNCKEEYIASIDADVCPEPEWLENLMREFINDDIAAVGGSLWEEHKISFADKWRDTHMRQCWGRYKLNDVPFLFGSNTCFKKECIVNAGMYDEKAITNGEDVYISERIHELEKKLVFTPFAKCNHMRKDTIKSIMDTRWRWTYFGDKFYLSNSIKNTWEANKTHFKYCRETLLKKDLITQPSMSNIIIDILCPFFFCYLDWKTFISSRFSI